MIIEIKWDKINSIKSFEEAQRALKEASGVLKTHLKDWKKNHDLVSNVFLTTGNEVRYPPDQIT